MMNEKLLSDLLTQMKKENYSGWDPYDGLESRIFRAVFLNKLRIFRLAWEQAFKKSPINLRKLFLVPKKRNPKAIALVVLGLLNLYAKTKSEKYKKEALELLEWLKSQSSKDFGDIGWGYPFDWQSRLFFAPKGTPNMVCTYFVGFAFLRAYKLFGDKKYLSMAEKAGKFMVDNLYTYSGTGNHFSYTPLDKGIVHNVNVFGAEFLLMLWKENQDTKLKKIAMEALEFTFKKQNKDGSWYYGEEKERKWIDNFHTGYILCSLKNISKIMKTFDQKILERGYNFYTENLFTENMVPKYFHNNLYPVDIHCCAQAIITFLKFRDMDKSAGEKVDSIFDFTMKNLYSENSHFYFQKHRIYTIKIPYMRWSDAWMFYALSELG